MTPLAWMDVISTDINRTLDYYAAMFGWTSEPLPLDHGEGYRLVRSGSVVVAGAEQVAAERELEPEWTLMIESDDARTLIDAAVAEGATETFELAPMLDLGRIAMVRDPWGATLGVWEPGTYRPSAVPELPGRLAGAVLTTPEVDDSIRFHRDVFGWEPVPGPHDLDAGMPTYVRSGPAACWMPILRGPATLRGPAANPTTRESDPDPRLTGAGLRRCVDPTGASFYLLSHPGANSRSAAHVRVAQVTNPRGHR